MDHRSLPSVMSIIDTRAPVNSPKMNNFVSIASILNPQIPTRSLGMNRHGVNRVSIPSILNAKIPLVKRLRLVPVGGDILECDIPELEIGSLGEPAVKFNSTNKGLNHFPSHTEDLQLLATSTCAYIFEPTAMMETYPPLQSELKSHPNSPGNFGLEPWVVSFADRYQSSGFPSDTSLQKDRQLLQRSRHQNGHGISSNLADALPFSGILKERRLRVRNGRSRFGSKISPGDIASGLVLENHNASNPSVNLRAIVIVPRPIKPIVAPASRLANFGDIVSNSILGGRPAPLFSVGRNALVAHYPGGSAAFPLMLEDSEFRSAGP